MTEQAITPLRRRMIEDMTIRKFAQVFWRRHQASNTRRHSASPMVQDCVSAGSPL
jgi:hypothetical protein